MELILDGILKAFQLLFTFNPEVLGITWLSLQVSGAATLISVLIGISMRDGRSLESFPGKKISSQRGQHRHGPAPGGGRVCL